MGSGQQELFPSHCKDRLPAVWQERRWWAEVSLTGRGRVCSKSPLERGQEEAARPLGHTGATQSSILKRVSRRDRVPDLPRGMRYSWDPPPT